MSSELELQFLERSPASSDSSGRSPALIFLHGVGSHEGDLFSLSSQMDPRFHVFSLRAPIELMPGSYAWFHVEFTPHGPIIRPDEAEASRRALANFLETLPDRSPVDPDRVFLLGFSQGAIMGLALTLTRPDLLAGVVAVSGRTLPELFAQEGPLAGKLAPESDLEGFPLLVVHGLRDNVLPIHYGRATRERFSTLPVALEYREYDMPHSISGQSLEDIRRWLAARLEALRSD